MPIEHARFCGNSLPIREVDMLSTTRDAPYELQLTEEPAGLMVKLQRLVGGPWVIGNQPQFSWAIFLQYTITIPSIVSKVSSYDLVILNNDGGGIFHCYPSPNKDLW